MKYGIKVHLNDPSDFLIIKESLTRIGIASNKKNILYQSAHILHRRCEYFIIHFLEMFLLDGKQSTVTDDDLARRNLIAKLLEDWGLLSIVETDTIYPIAPSSSVKVLPFKDKDSWQLVSKYTVGTPQRRYTDKQR